MLLGKLIYWFAVKEAGMLGIRFGGVEHEEDAEGGQSMNEALALAAYSYSRCQSVRLWCVVM